ncbi:hypothetical protein BT69DRAFT_350791 [Atractiella rhizophila]|nr:hypothetical protein BT69DRAFT_350791 [Atractiella rhizophila]
MLHYAIRHSSSQGVQTADSESCPSTVKPPCDSQSLLLPIHLCAQHLPHTWIVPIQAIKQNREQGSRHGGEEVDEQVWSLRWGFGLEDAVETEGGEGTREDGEGVYGAEEGVGARWGVDLHLYTCPRNACTPLLSARGAARKVLRLWKQRKRVALHVHSGVQVSFAGRGCCSSLLNRKTLHKDRERQTEECDCISHA